MTIAESRSERIKVRTTPGVKALLQQAAASSNKNVTEFLLDARLNAAEDILGDQWLFRLDDDACWKRLRDQGNVSLVVHIHHIGVDGRAGDGGTFPATRSQSSGL